MPRRCVTPVRDRGRDRSCRKVRTDRCPPACRRGEEVEKDPVEVVRIPCAGHRIVDPVIADALDRVPGAQGFGETPRHFPRILLALLDGPEPQAIHEIVADRAGEQDRVDAHIDEVPSGHLRRKAGKVASADRDGTAEIGRAPADDPRHGARGRRPVGDQRGPRGQLDHESDVLEDEAPVGIRRADLLRDQRADERFVLAGNRLLLLDREQPLGREMLHDLIVLHLHVEPLLIPVDQFLQGAAAARDRPRSRRRAGRCRDCPQSQIAADGVEQERRHLRQKIVQELHRELALVDVEPEVEELEEPVADLGPLPGIGVVDVTASMPSTTSPTRPASRRDAIWRCLPRRSSSRRSFGMIVNWESR